jgi:hypothetical protein
MLLAMQEKNVTISEDLTLDDLRKHGGTFNGMNHLEFLEGCEVLSKRIAAETWFVI